MARNKLHNHQHILWPLSVYRFMLHSPAFYCSKMKQPNKQGKRFLCCSRFCYPFVINKVREVKDCLTTVALTGFIRKS
jgi:hypothetical protein